MIAYKLVRQMADGSLASLFINKVERLPIGKWLQAGCHPTKGFATRPGWHCTLKPHAPHLKLKPAGDRPRVWVKVLIENYEVFVRPAAQGGQWALAQRMKIVEVMV